MAKNDTDFKTFDCVVPEIDLIIVNITGIKENVENQEKQSFNIFTKTEFLVIFNEPLSPVCNVVVSGSVLHYFPVRPHVGVGYCL